MIQEGPTFTQASVSKCGTHLLGCQDTLLPSRLQWLCSDCLTVNIHWILRCPPLKKSLEISNEYRKPGITEELTFASSSAVLSESTPENFLRP